MTQYEVAVEGIQARCPDVLSVRFTRPDGYRFRAGQHLGLVLATADGTQTKRFSFSSATQDTYLEITTRLSGSAFKAALSGLAPGDRVWITSPAGRLALPLDEPRVAFLAGGVGITPIISMLASHPRIASQERVLIYGNRDADCVPFTREIASLEHHGLRVVHVFETAEEGFAGERGLITPELVAHHLGPVDGWLFIVAGPPLMVSAMERCLDALGVDGPRRSIERFGPRAG
ncbi:MAG TPA: FAD-dependent oxidoreductase [Coriobacteriia bacterium]|nr:FAD-dependent oxidoreductase [Coriobacteriia bacterium]